MSFLKSIIQNFLSSVLVAVVTLIAGLSFLTKKFPPDFEQIKDYQKHLNMIKNLDHTAELMKKIAESPDDTLEESQKVKSYEVSKSGLDVKNASAGEDAASVAAKVRVETARNQLQSAQTVQIQKLKAEVDQLRLENEALREKLHVDR
jgi:hypothetical protein